MPSSGKRVHFGLGNETTIKSIEIRWPHSALQKLEKVPVDKILKIEEATQ